MTASPLTAAEIKKFALGVGFDECRITVAKELDGYQRLLQWLAAGYDGSMSYIRNRLDAYRHPTGVHPGTQSVVMLVSSYHSNAAHNISTDGDFGRVARYAASGLDYHDVLHDRMKRLIKTLNQAVPSASFRGAVDSAPLLEREFAQQAGLGWIGKNTMLISRKWGSYFFLSALLTNLKLEPDSAFTADHCGTCRACLDACPTQAFVEPHVLDATRCISYLTIENKDLPPHRLRSELGSWVFGCDVCQEVCPWNRKAQIAANDELHPRQDLLGLNLEFVLAMTEQEFRARFRKTPIWRAKLVGIQRNALIAMTNQRHFRTQRWAEVFITHSNGLLRLMAAWSLMELATDSSRQRLQQAIREESDVAIAREMRALLDNDRGMLE